MESGHFGSTPQQTRIGRSRCSDSVTLWKIFFNRWNAKEYYASIVPNYALARDKNWAGKASRRNALTLDSFKSLKSQKKNFMIEYIISSYLRNFC